MTRFGIFTLTSVCVAALLAPGRASAQQSMITDPKTPDLGCLAANRDGTRIFCRGKAIGGGPAFHTAVLVGLVNTVAGGVFAAADELLSWIDDPDPSEPPDPDHVAAHKKATQRLASVQLKRTGVQALAVGKAKLLVLASPDGTAKARIKRGRKQVTIEAFRTSTPTKVAKATLKCNDVCSLQNS